MHSWAGGCGSGHRSGFAHWGAVSEGRQLIELEGPGLMEGWATSSVGVGHCWPVLPWASGAIDACAEEGTAE